MNDDLLRRLVAEHFELSMESSLAIPDTDCESAAFTHQWIRDDGRVIRVCRADSFVDRLRGVKRKGRRLTPGHGLLLKPCWSVHGFGVEDPMDIVFIGSDWKVVKIDRLEPASLCWALGAKATLELPLGDVRRFDIQPGDFFQIKERSRNEYGYSALFKAQR